MTATSAHRAIDTVWRIESPRLIAGLARMVRDVGVAEDLAQDALVAALEQWPQSGVPGNPGAWLMAIAKRRAIDRFRREELSERKFKEVGFALQVREDASAAQVDDALDDDIGDDLLRLVFIACHPLLAAAGRVALTLRLLGGLTTARSRERSSSRRRRSRSESCARSVRSPQYAFRSKCHMDPTARRDSRRCSRFSTSFSTRDTAPRLERTGCAPRSARTPFAWAASLPS